ncbi:helix-turn-helix domain-containing protein [Pseudomonas avellanae]|uniref:Transcriptional regulator n=1 Tax=Pseudomonas avellanae TaxID=46257 RepID=A0A3M5U0S9_9PSED|nr:helix-turn-helix transcriptional regulator [Pseudomonas avellanae]EKG31597.1 transcriptional regulator [Pseudomonas avellanae BPIC 631]RMU39382.1 Transcriptional regulator [Pseudomonas avellanae]UQW69650.1 helix-turn-helix domain-containing protein [Pseudomonas avellanae]UQW76474.1 helix-turn-helix domain-containing protein [Pseudomonas avellanae]GGJ11656.1 transcriptional regulator [Pseudomonas avellanae]
MTGIGPRLKKERLRLKISQSALGAIGGVETNAQGNYENGVRSPRADYLSRIADAGVNVTYVVTGFSNSSPTLTAKVTTSQESDPLNRVVARLHGDLHNVTQNIYHVTRLMESNAYDGDWNSAQLETIKNDAEAITVATVRLIYMTSKLK